MDFEIFETDKFLGSTVNFESKLVRRKVCVSSDYEFDGGEFVRKIIGKERKSEDMVDDVVVFGLGRKGEGKAREVRGLTLFENLKVRQKVC